MIYEKSFKREKIKLHRYLKLVKFIKKTKMGTLANNYIFKALDAYPYDLEEAIEALTYALAYEEKNTSALCLMGRIHAEALYDYEKAKEYFAEALAENIYAFNIYPNFINVLLWNEDFEEAEKLINFGITVKGSDKAVLYLKKAVLYETKKEYKKALKQIAKAKTYNYNNDFTYTIEEEEKRIKGKLPKKKSKSKKDKKRRKRKNKFNYAKRMRSSVQYLHCYYEKDVKKNGEVTMIFNVIILELPK